ncbi:amino acid ABC transporter membrane protein 2, PAAT family [Raineyella antarctica]|uniref:Amino acid ABC transporter membrane protein 2, PAAT family n=1 Tax=Raineyella antarctica TaxID=1577474 RepID=A0A1G6GQM5_9ACTN|nr:amino acid ABC transporter permease [Raineyella antarctica]SDB84342.1 amino acid ABC transporter membrane protein 2, PAAT family [Raineyella antarctica]
MSAAQATVLFDAPGPRAKARNRLLSILGTVLILALVGGLVYGLRGQLTGAKWVPFLRPDTWVSYLLPGVLNTLQAAVLSVVTASVLGLGLALGRMSFNRPLSVLCTVLIEFFRAVPVLMMMLFVYFLTIFVPVIANLFPGPLVQLKPLVAVVAGLTFYNSAVIAELLRSGVGSLPRGQTEAGLGIGMSIGQTRRLILLPQAITAMLPALVSQLVVIVKDSALGYIISYPELLRSSQTLASRWSNSIAAFLVAAALFILLNWSLTRLAGFLEGRGRARQAGRMVQLEEIDVNAVDRGVPRGL